MHLDQIADGDEANQPALLYHRHVAKSACRHFRHEPLAGVGLLRRNYSLGHKIRDRLVQNLVAGLADRAHEIALRHDARDLVIVSQDNDAANTMLREQFCDIERDLFAFDVTTPPPLNFRMVAAFVVLPVSSGHGSPLSENALKTRQAAEIIHTAEETPSNAGNYRSRPTAKRLESLRCYIRTARHMHLNRLCGIGRYFRREHTDFVCLHGQHAELFAQKGRLQFDDVGEVLGAYLNSLPGRLASTLRRARSMDLRLNAAAPWPTASKDLSNVVTDASNAFKERSSTSQSLATSFSAERARPPGWRRQDRVERVDRSFHYRQRGSARWKFGGFLVAIIKCLLGLRRSRIFAGWKGRGCRA